MNDSSISKKWSPWPLICFFSLTLFFGSVFTLMLIKGEGNPGGGALYGTGRMWSPGIAAILTLLIFRRELNTLGWSWGPTTYIRKAYFIPLAYAIIVYGSIWLSGYGGFYNQANVAIMAKNYGLEGFHPYGVIAIYFFLNASLGMVISTAYALGEEIGWRGFLVPELMKKLSFTQTSILTGLIWSVWHYPVILYTNYNNGATPLFSIACFSVMIIGSSFVYSWLRMRSGSLWPCAIFHASHNLFILKIMEPLTTKTEYTKYLSSEFGLGMVVVSILLAWWFWGKRDESGQPEVL